METLKQTCDDSSRMHASFGGVEERSKCGARGAYQ